MYSWVIKHHLKSNVKECYVVSGNTKDVVSMKINQLCQGQLLLLVRLQSIACSE